MNFFGHAALAADHFRGENPSLPSRELWQLCLGAMLPDFVSMLRLRRPQVQDAMVARGVSFHHRTDHFFHDLDSFHQLSHAAFAWLSQRGMPKGPARAVAHVGIEILLDESMAEDAEARAAYLGALETPLASTLRLESEEDLRRLDALRDALRERAANYRQPSSDVVARRIRRTLDGRPRLATDDEGEVLLREWVEVTRPAVRTAAPALLATLRAQLAHPAGAE